MEWQSPAHFAVFPNFNFSKWRGTGVVDEAAEERKQGGDGDGGRSAALLLTPLPRDHGTNVIGKSSLTQDQFEIQTGLGLHLKPLCASMSVSTDKWRSLTEPYLLSCKMGIWGCSTRFSWRGNEKHMPSPESKCCWAPVDAIFPNAPLPVLWPNKAIFLFFFLVGGLLLGEIL